MSGKVVPFTGVTYLDLEPEMVLHFAKEQDLTAVVVVGYTADGEEYFAASMAEGPEALWLLERAKLSLLMIEPEEG